MTGVTTSGLQAASATIAYDTLSRRTSVTFGDDERIVGLGPVVLWTHRSDRRHIGVAMLGACRGAR